MNAPNPLDWRRSFDWRGLSTYLYVLSHNLWCPLGKSAEGL